MDEQTALQEIEQEAAEPSEAVAAEPTPEILRYKTLYGKSNKPMYFEHDDGRCFDCDSENWLDKKPLVAHELSSRPINTSDLLFAILHGLVDKPTYDVLQSKGLVADESRRAFEKLQKIHEQIQQASLLNKSDEGSEDGDFDVSDDYFDEPISENELEGDEDGDILESDLEEEVGTNVVQEIMALAERYCVEPKLEDLIRRIVREEMSGVQGPQAEPEEAIETEDEQLV